MPLLMKDGASHFTFLIAGCPSVDVSGVVTLNGEDVVIFNRCALGQESGKSGTDRDEVANADQDLAIARGIRATLDVTDGDVLRARRRNAIGIEDVLDDLTGLVASILRAERDADLTNRCAECVLDDGGVV